MREVYNMIDIETTGTDKENDDILEVAVVQIERNRNGLWQRTQKPFFHRRLYSSRQPETEFAKKHMKELYEACNKLDPIDNCVEEVSFQLAGWLHENKVLEVEHQDPKYFMGWNASNFDLEFCFKKNLLTPSYYVNVEGKEVLKGDVHYRVYEQTGAIEYLCDMTGFSRKTLMSMCDDIIENDRDGIMLPLPEGKQHDAIHDCYSQINMMNALILLGRKYAGK